MILKIFHCRTLCMVLLSITSIVLIMLYYNAVQELSDLKSEKDDFVNRKFLITIKQSVDNNYEKLQNDADMAFDISESNEFEEAYNYNTCEDMKISSATIKTVDVYENFTFEAPWTRKNAGIWQKEFEQRFNNLKSEHPLKIFILPHSHNDPGWLQTFEGYFNTSTKNILDLVVEKLTLYKEMKFIWTEISFLDLWWKSASFKQKNNFKRLIKEKRLEIMTGGWVMTDEANVHYHAMLDQLIEGHQWVQRHLEISPKIGWSIDPFGQGSTVPHLLAMSDLKGAIIQRIHYNWKEFLARHQYGDFYWKSMWDSKQSSEYTILTHNMPFDIYSTRHSCGPQPKVCDSFEFNRNLPKINEKWLDLKVPQLIEQYGKTASLFPHNVALVLVGGDFTYSKNDEFEREFQGYEKIIKYINENSEKFNKTTAHFGTPSEYFNEIQNRLGGEFPSLVGDFFPYADIFSTGMPAYWTGYFSTRPFYKLMSRDLEHNLRNAEILFTISYNRALGQGQKYERFLEQMQKGYATIVEARKNLGLFQHHDAITGTSRLIVMKDYLSRLQNSIKNVVALQQETIAFLIKGKNWELEGNFLDSEIIRLQGLQMPSKKIIEVKTNKIVKILIFNSLTRDRTEAISLKISSAYVKVSDSDGNDIECQVNPVSKPNSTNEFLTSEFELIFIANLTGMSLNTFTIFYDENDKLAKLFCNDCINNKIFKTLKIENELEIENSLMKLTFNKSTGLIKSITKDSKTVDIKISFGGYKSRVRASGAYLFKPQSEIDGIFDKFPSSFFITKGPIASDVTVVRGNVLTHKLRIFNSFSNLNEAIKISNELDIQTFPKRLDVEFFMRISTSIRNGEDTTEFYTDQNGFQWMPRRKIPTLTIESSYYPITSSAFMQDNTTRLTLITNHAQGAAGFNEGELEVMIDRRIWGDDNRGMGEGISDSIKMQHDFYLSIEFSNERKFENYQLPSLNAQQLTNALNYPVNIFTFNREVKHEEKVELFTYQFPCDFHLVNLRTLSNKQEMPTNSALMVIHRLGYDCQFSHDICKKSNKFHNSHFIHDLKVSKLQRMSLTGNNLRATVTSFNEPLEPMEIRTYNITF